MVLPLDFSGLEQHEATPQVVKEVYSKLWWGYVGLIGLLVVARAVAQDVLGALSSVMLGVVTWCMVKDGCARMSQLCVFCFGAMSASQVVIEAVALVGLLGGRTFGQTTSIRSEGDKHVFTTVVEKHPFFDPKAGSYYNFQSAVIMVAPAISLIGAVLSYLTYKAYATSLFEAPDGVTPYEGYGTTLGGGGGQPRTSSNQQQPRWPAGGGASGGGAAGHALGRPQHAVFSGEGQRLGAA